MKQTLLLLFCLLFHLPDVPAQSPRNGKDYAVFFYVTDYDKDEKGNKLTSLPDTQTECENLRNILRDEYGFDCKMVPNATLEQIRATMAAYNDKKYAPDDQVLFFFSMHGYYNAAADRGYLAPKGAKMQDTYRLSWFSYDELGTYLALCPAKHVLLALDACYSGSFGIRNKSGPSGPDYEQEPDCAQKIKKALRYSSRIFYTSGSKADKTPGKSLFASRWLEALRAGGEGGVLRKRDLETWLGKIESPEPEFGSFKGHEEDGNFVFVRKNACGAGGPDDGALARDLSAWKAAKAANTVAAYQKYLGDFANGEFRELANTALQNLENDGRRQRDDLAYNVAVEKNTEAAYQKYLADFPYGEHRSEAAQGIEALNKTDNMVLVRGGTFQMGREDGGKNEKPVHTVTISDFYLSKYELTVAEFKAFVDATGYQTDAEKSKRKGSELWDSSKNEWKLKSGINWRHNSEGDLAIDNHPVVNISWNDALAYCEWLSKRTGKSYRLPTEAEWEYAAGNGSKHTKYSWGNSNPTGRKGGNVADETLKKKFSQWKPFIGYTDGFVFTAPVGSFDSNEFGLYDMTGNVWEWCSDWYDEDYYKNSPTKNPIGPTSGVDRVIRGGCWCFDIVSCQLANRNNRFNLNSYSYLGFRLARSL